MLLIPPRIALALALASAALVGQSQQWTDLGFGTAGANGVPQLQASNFRYGRALHLRLQSAAGSAPVFFIAGLTRIDYPVLGGTLVPNPDLSVFVPANPLGQATLRLRIPDLCPDIPLALFAQAVVVDPASASGFAFSNAITATIRDNVPSDFNGDGWSDLAIGVPDEDVSGQADAGAVSVVYGSPAGLTNAGSQLVRQGFDLNGLLLNSADAGEGFGSSLAVGDFDGDGYDDLAIGVPRQNASGPARTESGAVHIIYGSAAGLQGGNAGRDDQVFRQGSNGVQGTPDDFDWFGKDVSSGDYNGDGYDDLAIGVPFENGSQINDGAVHILYGSANGLSGTGDRYLVEPHSQEQDDRFGWTLESGDFDGDGYDDLAVGRPYEDVNGAQDAGAVTILYFGPAGVVANENVHLDATIHGNAMQGAATIYDLFGFALAAGDFNDDGVVDLAIGIPYRDLNGGAISAAGAVSVVYGSLGIGIVGAGNQLWTQDTPGVLSTAQLSERFGYALAAGDFDHDGASDLAIGVPRDQVGGIRAGSANVLFGGSGTGLSAAGNQLWNQNALGLNTSDLDDEFGWSLGVGRFDEDCRVDLVFGIPSEVVNGVAAGAVEILYWGSVPNQAWSQAPLSGAPQAGDRFGAALVAAPDQRPL